MLVIKVLETTIDLLNPNDIYALDIDKIIHDMLSKRYLHKCFQSVLITKINKIIRRSSIRIVDNRIDGGAYVDVTFEVTGIIFLAKELVTDCKIIEILGKNIFLEHKFASIKLDVNEKNNVMSVLNVGDIIPMSVIKVRYPVADSSISMLASVYMPKAQDTIVYVITNGLDQSESERLKILLNNIRIEEEKNNAISKKQLYKFFQDFLYPYKNQIKYESGMKAQQFKLKPIKLDFDELSKIEGGLLVYPSEDNRSNRRLFHSTAVPDELDKLGDLPISYTLYKALTQILTEYLCYLNALYNLVMSYNSEDNVSPSYKALNTYWKFCNDAKI